MMSVSMLAGRRWSGYRGRLELAIQYLAGQGSLQLLNGLNGFWLLRWLSLEEQAKFSLAMALQATLSLLSDLGIGGSLLGLLGDRIGNKTTVGQYIQGIRRVRNRLLSVGFLVGGSLVFFYGQRHGWTYDLPILVGLLFISVYAQSESNYYALLLQAHRRLADYYRPQLAAALLRLLLSVWLVYGGTGFNAWLAVLLTTAGFVSNAWWLKRQAAAYYARTRSTPAIQWHVWQTLLPLAPMVFYYALQGQLTSFLAGLYGPSATVAELGALGRLSQFFALLSPFSSIVLMPYLARSSAGKVPCRFLIVCLGGVAVSLPVVAVGYIDPRPFLWLLGDRFKGLQPEIGFYLLSAAIWFVTSIVWAANMARCWTNWYTSLTYVGLTLATQCLAIAWLDLSVTHNLVRLGFYMACSTLAAYLLTAAVGCLNDCTRC